MDDQAQPLPGFSYSQAHFESLVDLALVHARKLGASDASAAATEGTGLAVGARLGELESIRRNRDKSLGVTVFVGQRRGAASTSDFAPQAIRQTVQAAYDIARHTAEDPAAGLPDAEDVATEQRPLDLFYPWPVSSEEAADIALACEQAALEVDPRLCNSEGAEVSAQQAHFFSAHTHGFRGGYASSRHTISVAPIAREPGAGGNMQRDFWYSSMRDPAELAPVQSVGRYAAERALSRLGARKIATVQCPVLFEGPLAAGLVGTLVRALSGGALYRGVSFLQDSLGQQLLPPHISLLEDPFLPKGKGSSPFDDEGVAVQARSVVDRGCVQGYFLGSYSARKLGLRTTGNAGGPHNLKLVSRATQASDSLAQMLRKLWRGLFVVELMGQGVNLVTGDYSRGASGFWVEQGQIAHPVQEITIAGNLRQMLADVQAVGADRRTYGACSTGSLLIGNMTVAGN